MKTVKSKQKYGTPLTKGLGRHNQPSWKCRNQIVFLRVYEYMEISGYSTKSYQMYTWYIKLRKM